MRIWLVLLCLLPWLAWAESPTPTPEPGSEREQTVRRMIESQEDDEAVPSAKDMSKPAVFGIMIASQQRERLGTPIIVIKRASLMPWIFSLLLLPVYLHIARRRGFRVKAKSP